MTSPLTLHLVVAPGRLDILVKGDLVAATAHLLSKLAVAALRRHPTPVLGLNLQLATDLDDVGVSAVHDCRCEAERRGVLFTITEVAPRISHMIDQPAPPVAPVQPAARHFVGRRPIYPARTGIICRANPTLSR